MVVSKIALREHLRVDPMDVMMLNTRVARFIRKYGANELNLRVNAVKRQHKIVQRTQRKLMAAENANRIAENRFDEMSDKHDVWESDDDE